MRTVKKRRRGRAKLLHGVCVLLFACCSLLCTPGGPAPVHAQGPANNADFPVVDPLYIYQQLAYLTAHFQRREAGYVTNQGHDLFASYWTQEMAHNLQGFGPQIVRDSFTIQGWQGRPASQVAFNMEVSVPGLTHPEQEVIIGCHYDGKADSTESAFDDTSGCAYELGVGQALGNYWRAHHLYPARTLRFVLFDAEEQGLFGSFHYLNNTINGDLANITAMFNEEQSGINYPARDLGRQANPFLPDSINVTPLRDNAAYPGRIHLSLPQRLRVSAFRDLWSQAIPAVFAQFRAEGYSSLAYYNDQRQNSPLAIFTADQQANLHIRDDPSSNSDQVPFIYAGLPVAMLTGDQSYYDPQPEPWAYPYDLPEDTLGLMNIYTGGNTSMSPALALALALPATLTTWMLDRPEIGGSVAGDGSPLALMSDIGPTVAGQPLALAASGFDPAQDGAPLTYTWNFGDSSTTEGTTTTHIYRSIGTYVLTLTTTSAHGERVIKKILYVGNAPEIYSNPYTPLRGKNTPRPAVHIPVADDTLPAHPPLPVPFAQTVSPVPQASASPLATLSPLASAGSPTTTQTAFPAWLAIAGLICLGAGLVLLGVLISRRGGDRTG